MERATAISGLEKSYMIINKKNVPGDEKSGGIFGYNK